MNAEQYKAIYTEDDAVGWLAIDNALQQNYGALPPRHYPPLCGVHFVAGGSDPIDGASIYDNKKQTFHRHIISYGMSELYFCPEKAGGDFSNWGFEFTFRLVPFDDDVNDPLWAVEVMNNLARYVFTTGNWFDVNHFIPAYGPVRTNTETAITGFVFALDPELGTIETAHGKVSFLQLVGITDAELDYLQKEPTASRVEQLINQKRVDNPLLITDLKQGV